MTEKRFRIVVEYDGAFSVGSEVIKDFKTGKSVDENIYEMCELLNSLNDENEELKRENERLKERLNHEVALNNGLIR